MCALHLNRYWGDENEKKTPDNSNSLSDLLQKIEERRKHKRKLLATPEKSNEVHNEPDEIKYKLEEPVAKKVKLDTEPTPSTSDDQDVNENFTIIKKLTFKKTHKVKRVLPNWLAKPSIVSADLKNLTVGVADIPQLSGSLVEQLKKNKITQFFPVQTQLIPWLLKHHGKCKKFWPRDVCVSAPTGSGKTLAFVLPVIQLLRSRLVCYVRAVAVLPTKDLAFQVFKVFKQYSMGTGLKVICLGNATLDKERSKLIATDELSGSRSLVDIIVTTPGRLVEHLKYTVGFSLNHLKFLIIDEADNVMETAKNDWLQHLQNRIPPFEKNTPFLTLSTVEKKPFRTQKLLFSATLSQDPEKLQQLGLFQPVLFTSVMKSDEVDAEEDNDTPRGEFIGKFSTPNELTEYYSICPLSVKPLVLYYLVKKHAWNGVLCFVDTVFNVHRLTKLLQQLNASDPESSKWNIVEIFSKLSQNVHQEVLRNFSKGKIDILVTTDSLARGIDIPNVKNVILYDKPKYAKNYIHRIGRTGRAGQQGTSLVLVTPEQKEEFNEILSTCGKTKVTEMQIDMSDLKKFEDTYKEALKGLKIEIQKEDENKKKMMKVEKKGRLMMTKRRKRNKKKANVTLKNK